MLIIDNKYLILHMRKCGGTSFCRGLIEGIDEDRLEYYGYTKEGEKRSAESKANGGVWKHSTAAEAKAGLGEDRYNSLEVWFVATRPYWERVASFYFYGLRHNQRNAERYKFVADHDFSAYINSRYLLTDTIQDYVTEDGVCIVDKIVRFEDMPKMFRRLSEKVNSSVKELPTHNANPNKTSYLHHFNGDDWAHLARKFKSEIDFLVENEALVPKYD